MISETVVSLEWIPEYKCLGKCELQVARGWRMPTALQFAPLQCSHFCCGKQSPKGTELAREGQLGMEQVVSDVGFCKISPRKPVRKMRADLPLCCVRVTTFHALRSGGNRLRQNQGTVVRALLALRHSARSSSPRKRKCCSENAIQHRALLHENLFASINSYWSCGSVMQKVRHHWKSSSWLPQSLK